jgi:DNA-binding response OmpR family regulator
VDNGPAALSAAQKKPPDLVVLDVMMPGMSGIDVCRELRGHRLTAALPVILLTARAQETDVATGFGAGADDYVIKPFSLRELTARVRAVLRRTAPVEERKQAPYCGEHLHADFEAVAVTVDGDPIRLTRREFELLRYLVQNRNRVVSRDRLLEKVWGYERLVETRSVDVHVGRLRSKLRQAGRHIETVIGLGYRFVD